MTRDCGQYRDDQRLWIVQGMTADLWGGGGSGYLNLTDTRSHFRGVCSFILPVPLSSRALSSRLL
ncbi:unnamed protein product [Staurois parvus]|uniref:Uncharacterized protein n=1 Tax=Staurois parvus TaxID=386267 RepID=A0ABN9BP02_9NEOB|nr:unnamed protein product [Staurois parvus]